MNENARTSRRSYELDDLDEKLRRDLHALVRRAMTFARGKGLQIGQLEIYKILSNEAHLWENIAKCRLRFEEERREREERLQFQVVVQFASAHLEIQAE